MPPMSPSPRPSPNNSADVSPPFASPSPSSLDAPPQPTNDLDLNERTQPSPAFPSSRPHRDPLTMKLPTLPADRHNNRVLTHPNFDRNLTVEKAKFETPPTLIDDDDAMLSSSTEGQAPAFSSSASTIGGGLSPTGKQQHNRRKSSPNVSNMKYTTKRRPRQSSPPLPGTVSPTTIFHRNLVDALSNVEDENERYVYYPSDYYASPAATDLHRVRTMPPSLGSSLPKPSWFAYHPTNTSRRGSTTTDYADDDEDDDDTNIYDDPYPAQQPPHTLHEDEHRPKKHRPKLRNHVMDYPRKPSAVSDRISPKAPVPQPPPRRSRRASRIHPSYRSDESSDDEEVLPLLRRRRRQNRKRNMRARLCAHIVIGLILTVLFLFVVTVYHAQPLTDMELEMGRVLASDKELIFDLHVHATNWNWWTVRIPEADLGVFAFTKVVPQDAPSALAESNQTTQSNPAEFLGNFYRFDEPLAIPSILYTRGPARAVAQVRIKEPGADKSGNDRWSLLIRYPYGLVTRGVLRYKLIPMGSKQSAALCDVVTVDPSTGSVVEEPDQGFCFKEVSPSL